MYMYVAEGLGHMSMKSLVPFKFQPKVKVKTIQLSQFVGNETFSNFRFLVTRKGKIVRPK